jgi:hypothetical protein
VTNSSAASPSASKKVVDYHLFSVMLWNQKVTQLEGVFSVHFGEPLPARFRADGILESMNAHEERFGFERLAETLYTLPSSTSCKAMCAAILAATDKFSGRPEEPHDDRTLIVLRVNGNHSRSSLKTTTEPPDPCRY